ncbi:MAG: hypothetical protein LIO74_05255 [Ruminococcus sp.]|nr:hypothetical protein [Ruminococcus sp.]
MICLKLGDKACSNAYNEMLKNGDRIDTAEKIGDKILEEAEKAVLEILKNM